ncbi:uncharacterized protein LOC106150767 [Lingula anatina]|uniref:Uncharacterized protein LOC106150767 n=1 Tax=Lingula anatina TaxID=7574 RepID=A0A1S3GZM7_LINAN|nr:uncharacterized protein LOC106150767 [Lingula anatina]|eukprot:XP_013379203.1 uncharacterized protein LOC106150767 [Lingula anatina]
MPGLFFVSDIHVFTLGYPSPLTRKILLVQTTFVLLMAINQVSAADSSDSLTTRRRYNTVGHATVGTSTIAYPKCQIHREYLKRMRNGSVECVSCDHHCVPGWGIALWCQGFMNTVCQQCVDGVTFSYQGGAKTERVCRKCNTCQNGNVIRNCTKFEDAKCSRTNKNMTDVDHRHHHTVILWTTLSSTLLLVFVIMIVLVVYVMKRNKMFSKLVTKNLHISFKRLNNMDSSQLLHPDGNDSQSEQQINA